MQRKISADRAALVFSVLVFLVYISSLSISLDDEDAVHFALALRDFDVTRYQPHPPGFPVYVALGMISNAVLNNEVLALTLMSAIFGSLAVYLTYLLFRRIVSQEVALASSVLSSLTPLFWLNSVKAMSDMTGLFFLLLSMLFIHRYLSEGEARDFYTGALLTGIAAGVRIHTLLILLPMLGYSAYMNRKAIRTHIRGALVLGASILLWLAPLMAVTGFGEYMSVSGEQYASRVGKPYYSLLGTDITPNILAARVSGFVYYFLLGGYGINLGAMGALSMALMAFMAFLALSFLKRISMNEGDIMFFVSGLVPYMAAVFVMLPPFNPRYLLITVPLLSLVFVLSLWNIKRTQIRHALFGVLVMLVAAHSVFLALEIRSIPAPPVQMIEHVNQNYGPETTILLSGFTGKYFSYYHSDLETLSLSGTDCGVVETILDYRTVLSVSGSEDCSNLRLVEAASFTRDARVHIKRSRITLYEFVPED